MVINRALMALEARRIKNLIVTMPPQHGKSTLITNYFATHYLGTFPDHEAIIVSYEHTFASTWGEKVRNNFEEFGAALWGLGVRHNARAADDWRLRGTMRGADGVVRQVTGGMRSAGIGSGITGRPMHLGIIDDPFKDNVQAMSAAYRQRVWDWYESAFLSRWQPTTVQVIVHTRWHEDDLIGRLLEKAPDDWYVLNLPALCEDVEHDALGRALGDPLWPQKYDRTFMQKKQESLDAYWWNSLYQQRPSPAGGTVFQKGWWSFWKPENIELPNSVHIPVEGTEGFTRPCITLPREFDDSCQSWDLTFDSSSSRVHGSVWKRRGGMFFVMDEEIGTFDFPAQIDAIARVSARNPTVKAKVIEDKANARALVATSKLAIPGLLLEDVEGQDKTIRAMGVSPLVKAGNVFLPHPAIAPWVWDFIAEHTTFPTGRFDDRVDTTSQALKYLYRRMMQKRVGGKQKRPGFPRASAPAV